jgi:hypothetical protein
MRAHTNDRLKGSLDLLVLKCLASQGKMHGYSIILRIGQRMTMNRSTELRAAQRILVAPRYAQLESPARD